MAMDLPPLLTSLWQPAHFCLGRGLRCAWQFEAEQVLRWELFRGRLVAPEQTRETKSFLTWNILPVIDGEIGSEPLLSLLFDEDAATMHVTRGFRCRVWRAVDVGGGIESEQVEAWVRELVGTLRLEDVASPEAIVAEIQSLIWHAIVGTSRLPLTSLEAPLTQFTFGQFAYVPRATLKGVDVRLPRRNGRELLQSTPADSLDERQRAKLLEFLLRSLPESELPELARSFADWLGSSQLLATFRRMFNDVSLSPYTDFVDRALDLLAAWTHDSPDSHRPPPLTPADEIDALAALLRQIARHLTAYDLVSFHYRGANYPDALLLDALLRRMFDRTAARADLVNEVSASGRLRRRALRMGYLLRRRYEGHAVPDRPTSPGENTRIFPDEHPLVPADQIDEPRRRTRLLFQDEPLSSLLTPPLRHTFAQACLDLTHDEELHEGGMALFVDRPLGFWKAPAETDQTPLLSYEAFSRRLAVQCLSELERLTVDSNIDVPLDHWQICRDRLAGLNVVGLSLDRVPDSPRPAVSLADARKVADDFIVVRTTPRSLREFWFALAVEPGPWPIVARIADDAGKPRLGAFDEQMRLCATFEGDWSRGSIVRRGFETPRAGLRWSNAEVSDGRETKLR